MCIFAFLYLPKEILKANIRKSLLGMGLEKGKTEQMGDRELDISL